MPRSYRDSRQRKAAMGRLASVRILRVVLPADPGLRPGGESADVLAMADDHEDGDDPRHLGTLAVGEPHRVNRREDDRHQGGERRVAERSEEHTSELQSLMRISYAVFCL